MKNIINMKKGFLSLGFVANHRPNAKGVNDLSVLSSITGMKISAKDLDDFVDSPNFSKEFLDSDGSIVENEADSLGFRFLLPWKSKNGSPIYGFFTRKSKDKGFVGVRWDYEKQETLYDLGFVDVQALKQLNDMSGAAVSDICEVQYNNVEFYNGAGYTKFPDGTPVGKSKAKYIRFSTPYKTKDGRTPIVGWFSKQDDKMQGISWGTDESFRKRLQFGNKFHFSIGRMKFTDMSAANAFLKQVSDKCMQEVWTFKDNKGQIRFPILKSYLECELDRLYYEKDVLDMTDTTSYKDRIIYNQDRTRAMFNTNLIDKFGHDLFLEGAIIGHGVQEFFCDMTISPSMMQRNKLGYANDAPEPRVPEFFKDINDIVFHVEWAIDNDMEKYEHIIGERRERFPKQYQCTATNILGTQLDNSIKLAQNIARRNYKFIVPMYYPAKHRIQLLMPIYLNGEYTRHPDFALVLTPHPDERIYTPETILGLKEVYQDARLIAKPETSWLNPEIIGEEKTALSIAV